MVTGLRLGRPDLRPIVSRIAVPGAGSPRRNSPRTAGLNTYFAVPLANFRFVSRRLDTSSQPIARGPRSLPPLDSLDRAPGLRSPIGRLSETYCNSVAQGAQVPCFGALPGTYSDYEQGATDPVMVVPTKKPPYADSFAGSIRFYTKYVGVALDPEGRSYGRFDP